MHGFINRLAANTVTNNVNFWYRETVKSPVVYHCIIMTEVVTHHLRLYLKLHKTKLSVSSDNHGSVSASYYTNAQSHTYRYNIQWRH